MMSSFRNSSIGNRGATQETRMDQRCAHKSSGMHGNIRLRCGLLPLTRGNPGRPDR